MTIDDVAQILALLGWGYLIVIIAARFFRTLTGTDRYKRKFAEYRLMRDEAMKELEAQTDISDSERVRAEISIGRNFARQLDQLDEEVARSNKIMLLMAATGGTAGIMFLLYHSYETIRDLLLRLQKVSLLTTPAIAADGMKTELAPLIPYVAMAVLGLMGISFFAALGTILLVKDTKENQARIKAADNIVKTFGGFFTGLATTLLHKELYSDAGDKTQLGLLRFDRRRDVGLRSHTWPLCRVDHKIQCWHRHLVGWIERSEIHQASMLGRGMTGLARAIPSCALSPPD
ncbi:hypothetical protein [Bradyrhizobium sp. NC92]|uniref:hypothetical protein n=1 Tax=Bradyrhizobium sp. (strain NC92) TaxID=55395 RepID=UPI0021AA5122|nr:hypothetical protein [Bradyrhizobium sp. NC92]UWU70632.1 hypothetical protein N2602_08935 [Bradyrhizobium sp. NC92]